MSTGEPVSVEKRRGVVIVTLNTGEGMNVLNRQTLDRISETLVGIESDNESRAVIIRGEKNFSAGADIRMMKDMTPAEAETFSRLGQRVCNQIEDMGKAVIAAISGYALGGGCEVASACDIRIAARNARLGQPEINIGLVPGFGGTQRLPRLVGGAKAKELLLTGRIIDAEEAEAIGLVNQVVNDDELMKRTEELATMISQKSHLVIEFVKKLVNEGLALREGLDHEAGSFSKCFSTEDHLEGMKAFLEKRAPKFRGV